MEAGKVCRVCGEHKPLTAFYKAAGCVDGRRGECAACFQAKAKARTLHVDHDHDTGRVRRLLCFTCNAGMGMFDHDPVLLVEAAEYLWTFAELDAEERTGEADATFEGDASR